MSALAQSATANPDAASPASVSLVGPRVLISDSAAVSSLLSSSLPSTVSYSSIKHLSIGTRTYSEASSLALCEQLLGKCVNLEVFDMSDCIASRPEAEALIIMKNFSDSVSAATKSSGCLHSVDVSNNAMGTKGVTSCAALLATPDLRSLKMCNDGLSQTTMAEVAETILASCGGDANQALKLSTLHFYNNMSGDDGCSAWSRIIERCDSLEDVRFSGTRASRVGSLVASKALDSNKSVGNIRHLDLADNTFTGEGGTILARAVSRMGKLEFLDLRDCSMEDSGIVAICDALHESGAPLKHLDLSGNEITAEGTAALRKLFRWWGKNASRKDKIEFFGAEENEFGSGGFCTFLPSLVECGGGSLKTLKVNCGEIGEKGGKKLLEVGGGFTVLDKVLVDGNAFSEGLVGELEEHFGEKLGGMEDNDDEGEEDSDDEEGDEDGSDYEDDEEATGGDAETGLEDLVANAKI